MASLKDLTATFSNAVGHRRYLLPSMAIAIGALLDFVMLRFGILIDANGPFAYLPFTIGVAVAASLILWWLLDCAAGSRSELRGIVNVEEALDGLSTYFDEGTQIFDAAITNDSQYRDWDARRAAWHEKVQEHLQENFGLRDKRSLIAQQLEKIRVTRLSDTAILRPNAELSQATPHGVSPEGNSNPQNQRGKDKVQSTAGG